MTSAGADAATDAGRREERLAEERFLLMAQTEMQRLLNDKELRYRDLSKRLGVSEARVSQMFGDDAANLTLRTIARVFHKLDHRPLLMCADEFERRLAEARGTSAGLARAWTFSGAADDLSVGACTEVVPKSEAPKHFSRSITSTKEWASAEAAADRRARAA
ncbi:MAG: hypothetical protein QOD42_3746 [Sphingomonadales bacterium]|jgi:DNA-binding Xre family transcriptional regulator|nr:hypothetical protein [Sphingomonadales bacterium]